MRSPYTSYTISLRGTRGPRVEWRCFEEKYSRKTSKGIKFGQVSTLDKGLATRFFKGTLFGGEAPEKHLGLRVLALHPFHRAGGSGKNKLWAL